MTHATHQPLTRELLLETAKQRPETILLNSSEFADTAHAEEVLKAAVTQQLDEDASRVLIYADRFAQYPWARESIEAAFKKSPGFDRYYQQALAQIEPAQAALGAKWREHAAHDPAATFMHAGEFKHVPAVEVILITATETALKANNTDLLIANATLLSGKSWIHRLILPLKETAPEQYDAINNALGEARRQAFAASGRKQATGSTFSGHASRVTAARTNAPDSGIHQG